MTSATNVTCLLGGVIDAEMHLRLRREPAAVGHALAEHPGVAPSRAARLGDHRDRNSRPFRELHSCTVPLGDARHHPTPTLSCQLSARGGGSDEATRRPSVSSGRCKAGAGRLAYSAR
jgi:hypothetical protein